MCNLVLDWEDNRDALDGKDGRAEEEREPVRRRHPRDRVGVGQRLREDVVKYDAQSDKLDDVGENGKGREVSEMWRETHNVRFFTLSSTVCGVWM